MSGCNGSGTKEQIIAGIEWVLEDSLGKPEPAVANMSLGGSAHSAEDQAVRNAIRLGITVTVSAGNENTNACNFSPARVAEAITVGATNSSDGRASFSNHGSCVDIFAPGSSIPSASNASNTATATKSGTSMAAPHVAGVAALYLQRRPNASPAQVREAIVNNATAGVLTNVGTGSPNMLLYSIHTPTPRTTKADYNGDGHSELAVFRPSTGEWWIRDFGVFQWGTYGDVPVPGDYTGDGRAEIAVWRPSTGEWWIRNVGVFTWGLKSDIPVPADYNGDGRVDLTVWRPSTGQWFVNGQNPVTWGIATDIPVPMYRNPTVTDFKAALVVYRPATGQWWTHGFSQPFTWGLPTDIPVPGRYKDSPFHPADYAVYRPTHFQWHVALEGTFDFPTGFDEFGNFNGGIYDIPVPADYIADGDGHEFAVWRPETGEWRIEGLSKPIVWGIISDIPISS